MRESVTHVPGLISGVCFRAVTNDWSEGSILYESGIIAFSDSN